MTTFQQIGLPGYELLLKIFLVMLVLKTSEVELRMVFQRPKDDKCTQEIYKINFELLPPPPSRTALHACIFVKFFILTVSN